jgi:DNA topoisomerase-3
MAKQLIIAEKPSVANDIARALGGFTRHGDYYESADTVLASAVGHLLELVAPETYEVKRGKWSLANLPVIPPHFDLKPIEKSEDRLKLLTRLIKRKDVTGLINACDAGREGELIFRYIVRHADTKKPIRRLWLQSMTPSAIREGFETLRADRELRPLADAAVSRSESDWLVGINGTRAMTAFNSKDGGFYKTTVGRVQTPTLAILVERETRIKGFVARNYWEVHGVFSGRGGEYMGRWFDERFERNENDPDARAERIWEEARAEQLRALCLGKPGIVTEEAKSTTQSPPLLFDLTSLQREANGRFGFSARTTLALAQALYERHKVLTYPRTDSRALPEDYLGTVRRTLEVLRGKAATTRPYAQLAEKVLSAGWVKPNKRIFNNAKVSDHFAIIPTPESPKHLSEAEAKLYDLVAKRFLAVFFPAAEFLVTTRITRVEGEPFKSEGRVMVEAGWLAVYGKETEEGETPTLPSVPDGRVATVAIDVQAKETKPPARYTEATLLTAMEGAGKLIDDEELREAMSEKGLGTPATRAAIIEGLIAEDYIHRTGRELQPTAKAFDLLYALSKFGIDELRSPELTGAWEFKLKQIEHGQLGREEFMDHIVETTRDLVERIKRGTLADDTIATLSTACPKCGGTVNENYKKFQCAKCDFTLWKVIAARRIENDEAEQLIRERVIGPLQGFRSRIGRPFSAMLRLRDDHTAELDFGQTNAEERAAPVDFSGKPAIGQCPKCGARVFDHELTYVCERAVGPDRVCDFRSGKIILQRPIEAEQMTKLLATGKTDLLHRFVSKKGRPFSAFLVRQPDGRIGFEFAPRMRRGTEGPAVQAKSGQMADASFEPHATRDAATKPAVYALKSAKGKALKRARKPRAKTPTKRTTARKSSRPTPVGRTGSPPKKRAA